jgi:hypothetical protein
MPADLIVPDHVRSAFCEVLAGPGGAGHVLRCLAASLQCRLTGQNGHSMSTGLDDLSRHHRLFSAVVPDNSLGPVLISLLIWPPVMPRCGTPATLTGPSRSQRDRGGVVGQESPSGVVRRDSAGVSVRGGDDQRRVGVHRRVIRQALAAAVPPERAYRARAKPTLDRVQAFIESHSGGGSDGVSSGTRRTPHP